MVEVKSTKIAKFIVLENFPLYGTVDVERFAGLNIPGFDSAL